MKANFCILGSRPSGDHLVEFHFRTNDLEKAMANLNAIAVLTAITPEDHGVFHIEIAGHVVNARAADTRYDYYEVDGAPVSKVTASAITIPKIDAGCGGSVKPHGGFLGDSKLHWTVIAVSLESISAHSRN